MFTKGMFFFFFTLASTQNDAKKNYSFFKALDNRWKMLKDPTEVVILFYKRLTDIMRLSWFF